MAKKLMGKKLGMTQIFDDLGRTIACTVIQVEPNVVTQIKTTESDGYNALQLGFQKVVAKDPRRQEARTRKPQRGHFAKAGVPAFRHLSETRVDSVEDYQVGQEFTVAEFAVGNFVDVTGISIGKGFQGAMKKFGFKGGPAAHGSGFHRALGSTGCRSTPGRCFRGGKRASQLGNKQVTAQNSQVMAIEEEDNLIILKGAVPGPRNGFVTLSTAKKKQNNSSGEK